MSLNHALSSEQQQILTDKEHTHQLEKLAMLPFPQQAFMQYTKTLDNYEKAEIAQILNLAISKKDIKKFPDLLFYKKLNILIKKTKNDSTLRKQLILFIQSQLISPEPTLENIQENVEQFMQEHGYWPLYWTIYYHSNREHKIDISLTLIEKMQSIMNNNSQQSMKNEAAATVIAPLSTASNDSARHEKKIATLEEKISKETQIRISLEQELVKAEKQNRAQKQEHDKLIQTHEQLKLKFNDALSQLDKQEKAIEQVAIKKREEEERWLAERNQLLQQNKQLLDEQKKLSSQIEQLNVTIEDSKKQIASLTQSQNWLQKQKENKKVESEKTEALFQALQTRLLKTVEQWNNQLLEQSQQLPTPSQHEQRLNKISQIMQTMQFIESMEKYYMQFNTLPQQEESYEQEQKKGKTIKAEPSKEDQSLYGTFYRRDHGGYILLDSGESFNITESLVQQLELQHEAEVLCTPNETAGKNHHYTIELLFQGDDSFSPILQFDGYVQLDSDQKWYCVDINDEERKFPIHFKDVDIQKPAHGDPCSFNVAEDGYIARLTKLYRLQDEINGTQFTQRKAEKAKTPAQPINKKKREPYLTGCTITIIGGQRKWFESVVKETGAELVHDGGEHPERIASDLARSQALFMILTSTSHRATWEGIEIAKANQIPHFIIQGSKSNLRSLLWENRELINSTNNLLV